MNLTRKQREVFVVALIAITVIILSSVPAVAQCPLCKLGIENSAQGKAMGRGLNLGILVLLVPPVTAFCSVFILAMKHRKPPAD